MMLTKRICFLLCFNDGHNVIVKAVYICCVSAVSTRWNATTWSW